VNLKGGVGKTTSAAFIASELAKRGKTLVVDADPQGSLLTWSGRAQALGQEFPYDVVGLPVDDIHKRLKTLAENFDHVVIDTPPGQLKIIRSAVLAADTVLIPVGPTMAEIDRVIPTIEIVAEVAALNEPEIWMLMTRVQRRTSISKIAREYLVNDMQMPVLETELPLWQRYATAFGLVPDDSPEYANVVRELLGEELVQTSLSPEASSRLRALVEGPEAEAGDDDVPEAHDISTAQGDLIAQDREHQEKLEEGRRILAEDEEEFGPIPQEVRDEVRARWPEDEPQAVEEGGDLAELSPEQEAEHREAVTEIAAEHGFPLPDWKPETGSGLHRALVDAALAGPREDAPRERPERSEGTRALHKALTDAVLNDPALESDGPVSVSSLDEALLEEGATPDELEDGSETDSFDEAREVQPADVEAWRRNEPVTFNGIEFESVWYDDTHGVMHAAVRDADWVVSIQTVENNGVRFDAEGQITGIDVRARNVVDGRAVITLPEPEAVAEAVADAVSETDDRGEHAGEAALGRDAQGLPDDVAAAELEERADESDTGSLDQPNTCTPFHYWEADWDNGSWFPEGWKFPHRCSNCGLEVLAANVEEATALAEAKQ
jgi:chromosome partitioning protein